MSDIIECDVAIVGLGPTGAMLANLLGPKGWRVVGLERDADIYYAPRAVHFDDEIMRNFQLAGLSDEIGRTSEPFADMAFRLTAKGRPAMRTVIGNQDRRYGHAGAWWFHQPTLEKHLRDGLTRFGAVQAFYGAEVVELAQHDHTVDVVARIGGDLRTVRARYVIGCDGGRSFVRRQAGLVLDSADFDEPWVVVDAKARCGGKDPTLAADHFQVCDPRQPVTYVPMAGPYYEWQFMVTGGRSEKEATDPAFVRRQLRDYVDLDRIDITRIAFYRFHALWARTWRRGGILLAGDSAHQMPPFLGQGMCSGIRDAVSLAWRLDLVLGGQADETVLDDYEAERSAHVRHIINGAMFLGNVIQTRRRAVAVARNALLFALPQAIPPLKAVVYALANRKRPLECGFIGQVRPRLAGRLLIQPEVIWKGAPHPLDDALGDGFVVLVRQGAAIPARIRAAFHHPVTLVSVGVDDSADVIDSSGALLRFMRRERCDLILVRPDRYVFDGGRMSDLARIAAAFNARFVADQTLALAA